MVTVDSKHMVIRDPEGIYPEAAIIRLLLVAERQGYSLEKGSILESMTVRQLDLLIHGRFDA